MDDTARREADAVRRGCTGGNDGNIGARDVLQDADLARGHIDNAARDKERRNLAQAASQHLVMIVFDVLDATDSGAHGHTNAVAVFLGDLETGVLDCVHRGGDAVMNKRIVLALVFRRQVGVDIETLHEPGNTRRECAGIEAPR